VFGSDEFLEGGEYFLCVMRGDLDESCRSEGTMVFNSHICVNAMVAWIHRGRDDADAQPHFGFHRVRSYDYLLAFSGIR
jgi:hypothetical protein